MYVTKKGKSSMGLAAGQARLLTITGRKSDCEYESMRLSHQKLAISRQLTDLSNEYQNSLDQTKLIYDYYGKGDESNPLSYGILMTPSTLNNYMPTLITDAKGRATLNSKLAAAAEAAGIPQEGLGTLPSENMRNKFIEALGESGVITQKMSETILSLPYNQAAGVGGGSTIAAVTQSGNIDDLIQHISDSGMTVDVTLSKNMLEGNSAEMRLYYKESSKGEDNLEAKDAGIGTTKTLSLAKLLDSSELASLFIYNNKTGNSNRGPNDVLTSNAVSVLDSIIDQVSEYFAELFNLGDTASAQALEYAKSSIQNLYQGTSGKPDLSRGGADTTNVGRTNAENLNDVQSYVGWISANYHKSNHNRAKGNISINNLLKAYLTYYADFVNGVSKTKSDGTDMYYVKKGKTQGSNLITDDNSFQYTWKTGTSVSSDDCAQATFYDSLFNQICMNGWTSNQNIDDNEYLQQMLKSGMLFISKVNDDGYYYQGNYATDNYIKEVSDDTKIAQAEAKYNTEKSKLNSKEQTLDLKMKNLDTEISSLTTEYDTIKNTISKNIEKSFKRYNA